MACRAIRQQLQQTLQKELLPAVPCIAVKNDLLINDPDFPEASDHFCTPPTIDESNQRLRSFLDEGKKSLQGMVGSREKGASAQLAVKVIKNDPKNGIDIEGHRQKQEIKMENMQLTEKEDSICSDFEQMNLADFELDKFEEIENDDAGENKKIEAELVDMKKEMEAMKLGK